MSIPNTISPGTPFGDYLTALAKEASTIVEFGTRTGLNSTRCLVDGLIRPEQHLFTTEVDEGFYNHAKGLYQAEPRVHCLLGHLLPLESYPEEFRDRIKSAGQLSSDALPFQVDLCLFDGGPEAITTPEFEFFHPRCRFVALDDTNPAKDKKCAALRLRILKSGWPILRDFFNDRTGWMVVEVGGPLAS